MNGSYLFNAPPPHYSLYHSENFHKRPGHQIIYGKNILYFAKFCARSTPKTANKQQRTLQVSEPNILIMTLVIVMTIMSFRFGL